ncbi:MutS-related protein [Bacillus ndiopicus]|uniref:MutS-related protein n=1 Tax=Bacillus ndiopicus TaxID=1347368 RepID=UPI0005AB7598|nr:hypothetical protein [Bacillus ndiopicus]
MKITLIIASFLVLITIINLTLNSNRRKIKKIREDWEQKHQPEEEPPQSVASYWCNKRDACKSQIIDDYTWHDLNMDEVYKKIKFTYTSPGSEKLYATLREIHLEGEQHSKREALIKKLSENLALKEDLQFILHAIGKKNYMNSSAYMYRTDEKEIKNKWVYSLCSALPLLSLLVAVFSVKIAIFLFFGCAIMNTIIYMSIKDQYESEFFSLLYTISIISGAKRMTKLEQPEIAEEKKELIPQIKKLAPLYKYVHLISKNKETPAEIVMDYLRTFFLVDFLIYSRMMKHLTKNQEAYTRTWEFVAEIDICLSILHMREQYTYSIPKFTEDLVIECGELYHPLLEDPVKNTFSTANGALITGSNASGKSTFIKSLALNCILAQTLHTVFADDFRMKRTAIFTSLAINDSLLQGESYFMAEMNSLKRMLDTIEQGIPCITFVDEILKGTNTIERISASAAILTWLYEQKNNLSIVASHDIELYQICGEMYEGYYFEGVIENNQMRFTYRINKGSTYVKNALELLQLKGFPKPVVDNAQRLSNAYIAIGQW